jgi:hypothetical protein
MFASSLWVGVGAGVGAVAPIAAIRVAQQLLSLRNGRDQKEGGDARKIHPLPYLPIISVPVATTISALAAATCGALRVEAPTRIKYVFVFGVASSAALSHLDGWC